MQGPDFISYASFSRFSISFGTEKDMCGIEETKSPFHQKTPNKHKSSKKCGNLG